MSQVALARTAGVTDRAISYWEAGVKIPNLMLLVKLAGALHVEFVCIGDGVLWREDPR
jgi:transcriptional regulator with XRE-family HTH domain